MKAELKPPRVVDLLYKAPGAQRWGTKDADAVSVEVRWAVLGHAPESIEELTHSAFATSGAVRLEFDVADRGKTVYCAVAGARRQARPLDGHRVNDCAVRVRSGKQARGGGDKLSCPVYIFFEEFL